MEVKNKITQCYVLIYVLSGKVLSFHFPFTLEISFPFLSNSEINLIATNKLYYLLFICIKCTLILFYFNMYSRCMWLNEFFFAKSTEFMLQLALIEVPLYGARDFCLPKSHTSLCQQFLKLASFGSQSKQFSSNGQQESRGFDDIGSSQLLLEFFQIFFFLILNFFKFLSLNFLDLDFLFLDFT